MTLQPLKNIGDFDSPLLIFGGPYSNLAATRALLAQAQKHTIAADHIICTGDVVAYAAEPQQTCDLIRQSGIHVVMGNCEESLALNHPDCGCGFDKDMLCSTLAVGWYSYAQAQVSDANRLWMHQLPRLIRFSLNGLTGCVMHGSVDQINRFIFASSEMSIKHKQMELANSDFAIGGHCGLPFGQVTEQGLWLNSGVIGLPANDGTRDGWYMLLEPYEQGIRASWHRLVYDYRHCQQQMLAAGLTDYADCIISGLWPSMDILPGPELSQQGVVLNPPSLIYQTR